MSFNAESRVGRVVQNVRDDVCRVASCPSLDRRAQLALALVLPSTTLGLFGSPAHVLTLQLAAQPIDC